MFNKKNSGNREGFDTLVGTNTYFEGNIESEGSIRIEGKIKGNVKAKGDIIIGKEAAVTGNVIAANINVLGTVDGNIHSVGILRIQTTAKIYGDIEVISFVVDEGAVFNGKCSMLNSPAKETENDKVPVKKARSEYKKSSALDQVYEEVEKVSEN